MAQCLLEAAQLASADVNVQFHAGLTHAGGFDAEPVCNFEKCLARGFAVASDFADGLANIFLVGHGSSFGVENAASSNDTLVSRADQGQASRLSPGYGVGRFARAVVGADTSRTRKRFVRLA
jgi:hypothetical protein